MIAACNYPSSDTSTYYNISDMPDTTATAFDFNRYEDQPTLNPLPVDFKLVMPVMGSMKNLSPNRLKNRRKKAKIAKQSRKKNRK